MRILFTRFPLESRYGGAEVQTLSLMKGLNERGHAVAFLGSCPTLLEETAKLRLPHAKLEIGAPPVTKWNAVSFLWKKQDMQRRLLGGLQGFHDLKAIFMLSLSEKLLATQWAHEQGIKVFWIEHDRIGPWLTKNPWLPQLKKLSSLATTICVSDLSRKIYLEMGWDPEKVIAIPNGIDLKKFSTPNTPFLTPNRTGDPPGRPDSTSFIQIRLGCVARLSPEKGVDLLIQAVEKLPGVDLTIVGTGPDEGYLRKLIEQIHDREMLTEQRIRILPRVNDLGNFYRSINVLVLPSRDNDPFGLVVAEAMACGTPVIVTNECGIAGYLTNGQDAVIVKADSQDALRDGIQSLAIPQMRAQLSKHGKQTAREKFSSEKMVDAYAALVY